MAMGFRPKLGMNLQNIVAGDQPPIDLGDFTPGQGMDKPKGGFFREGGMGRTIAGLIGDALLQQAEMAPVYAPAMRQAQQAAQEEAQWTRRRDAERQQSREDKQWEWQNKPPETPAMIRNAQAWMSMTPEQRTAYQQMETAERGDPFVTTTLPNGQFYAGPQSGLIGALTGSAAPSPAAPKGKLGPVVDAIPGGPQARPAGPFRP